MFLFSWFDTLQPRFYICLRVVRFASFLCQTLATLRCQPIVLGSWCVGRWTWLLRLQIKKWSSCRNNEVIALRISATFASEHDCGFKKNFGRSQRKRSGRFAILCDFKKGRSPCLKKKESAEAPSSLSWSWKLFTIFRIFYIV